MLHYDDNIKIRKISSRLLSVRQLSFFWLVSILVYSPNVLSNSNLTVVTECNQPCKTRKSDTLPDSLPTQIALSLLEITKDNPEIKVLPWARAYNIALTKKNTLLYSISRTPTREPLFNWIGDFEDEKYFVWGLKKNNNDKKEPQNISKGSYSTYRGSNEFDYLNKRPDITLQTVVYPSQRLHMVIAERVDYFVESEPTLDESCTNLNIDCDQFIKIKEVQQLNTPLSFAMSKNSDPDLVKKYQDAFSYLINSGKLAQVISNWQSQKGI